MADWGSVGRRQVWILDFGFWILDFGVKFSCQLKGWQEGGFTHHLWNLIPYPYTLSLAFTCRCREKSALRQISWVLPKR